MSIQRLAAVLTLAAGVSAQVATPERLGFARVRLESRYFAEGAAIGDLNRDGNPDVVAGPFWYPGPSFDVAHPIYPPRRFAIGTYADNFFVWIVDLNGDGWDDVLSVGLPGTPAHWFANPGRAGVLWQRHLVHGTVGMEAPQFVDVDGDGRRDLLCASLGRLGFLSPDPAGASQPWRFRPITPQLGLSPFMHGMGWGDINGDGRRDVVVKLGWFEQPSSLAGDPAWPFHLYVFGAGSGGAQMFVDDLDGDGDGDVVSSLDGHGYGLSWFEQIPAPNGGRTFVERPILPIQPSSSLAGVQFSQLHALAMVDVDRDGLVDIVTGKTYFAHNGLDPGARDPAVLYWFRRVLTVGGVRFVPHRVDRALGVGRQIATGDLDGDGRPDLAVSNKLGTAIYFGGS